MNCLCGHTPEDHHDEMGECKVNTCQCLGYEEDEKAIS